jgi:hypothetical protein
MLVETADYYCYAGGDSWLLLLCWSRQLITVVMLVETADYYCYAGGNSCLLLCRSKHCSLRTLNIHIYTNTEVRKLTLSLTTPVNFLALLLISSSHLPPIILLRPCFTCRESFVDRDLRESESCCELLWS